MVLSKTGQTEGLKVYDHWEKFVRQRVCVNYRPFPSSKQSHFQSEAKCEAIDMKMIFNYDANKIYFHNKGFALSLVLKVRFFGTRKWPNLIWLADVYWSIEKHFRT